MGINLKTDSYASLSLIHQRKKDLYITEPIVLDTVSFTLYSNGEWGLGFEIIACGLTDKPYFKRMLQGYVITLKHRDIQVILRENVGFILHNVTVKILTGLISDEIRILPVEISNINMAELENQIKRYETKETKEPSNKKKI